MRLNEIAKVAKARGLDEASTTLMRIADDQKEAGLEGLEGSEFDEIPSLHSLFKQLDRAKEFIESDYYEARIQELLDELAEQAEAERLIKKTEKRFRLILDAYEADGVDESKMGGWLKQEFEHLEKNLEGLRDRQAGEEEERYKRRQEDRKRQEKKQQEEKEKAIPFATLTDTISERSISFSDLTVTTAEESDVGIPYHLRKYATTVSSKDTSLLKWMVRQLRWTNSKVQNDQFSLTYSQQPKETHEKTVATIKSLLADRAERVRQNKERRKRQEEAKQKEEPHPGDLFATWAPKVMRIVANQLRRDTLIQSNTVNVTTHDITFTANSGQPVVLDFEFSIGVNDFYVGIDITQPKPAHLATRVTRTADKTETIKVDISEDMEITEIGAKLNAKLSVMLVGATINYISPAFKNQHQKVEQLLIDAKALLPKLDKLLEARVARARKKLISAIWDLAEKVKLLRDTRNSGKATAWDVQEALEATVKYGGFISRAQSIVDRAERDAPPEEPKAKEPKVKQFKTWATDIPQSVLITFADAVEKVVYWLNTNGATSSLTHKPMFTTNSIQGSWSAKGYWGSGLEDKPFTVRIKIYRKKQIIGVHVDKWKAKFSWDTLADTTGGYLAKHVIDQLYNSQDEALNLGPDKEDPATDKSKVKEEAKEVKRKFKLDNKKAIIVGLMIAALATGGIIYRKALMRVSRQAYAKLKLAHDRLKRAGWAPGYPLNTRQKAYLVALANGLSPEEAEAFLRAGVKLRLVKGSVLKQSAITQSDEGPLYEDDYQKYQDRYLGKEEEAFVEIRDPGKGKTKVIGPPEPATDVRGGVLHPPELRPLSLEQLPSEKLIRHAIHRLAEQIAKESNSKKKAFLAGKLEEMQSLLERKKRLGAFEAVDPRAVGKAALSDAASTLKGAQEELTDTMQSLNLLKGKMDAQQFAQLVASMHMLMATAKQAAERVSDTNHKIDLDLSAVDLDKLKPSARAASESINNASKATSKLGDDLALASENLTNIEWFDLSPIEISKLQPIIDAAKAGMDGLSASIISASEKLNAAADKIKEISVNINIPDIEKIDDIADKLRKLKEEGEFKTKHDVDWMPNRTRNNVIAVVASVLAAALVYRAAPYAYKGIKDISSSFYNKVTTIYNRLRGHPLPEKKVKAVLVRQLGKLSDDELLKLIEQSKELRKAS